MKNWIIWCAAGVAVTLAAGCAKQPPAQSIELGGGMKLEMVFIPVGSFAMGDHEGGGDEIPVHNVRITKPFYLGKYEVTVGQFRRFVEETNYTTDAEKGTGFRGAFGWDVETKDFTMNDRYSWRNTGFAQSDDHPVVNVSWNDAMEFCKWLSRKDGKTYRLPTEAEWEYACRAGTTTRYYHDNAPEGLEKIANVADAAFEAKFPGVKGLIQASDGYAHTSPVGSFLPNRFGLYDMHGNVWEWCADWYEVDYYAKSPTNDPTGPDTGEERAYRGGGWFNCARGSRCASRSTGKPEHRSLLLGFRVALRAD